MKPRSMRYVLYAIAGLSLIGLTGSGSMGPNFVTTHFGLYSNESVELGGVKWTSDSHKAFETAKQLGKPVLTLQMMGRLDDDFC